MTICPKFIQGTGIEDCASYSEISNGISVRQMQVELGKDNISVEGLVERAKGSGENGERVVKLDVIAKEKGKEEGEGGKDCRAGDAMDVDLKGVEESQSKEHKEASRQASGEDKSEANGGDSEETSSLRMKKMMRIKAINSSSLNLHGSRSSLDEVGVEDRNVAEREIDFGNKVEGRVSPEGSSSDVSSKQAESLGESPFPSTPASSDGIEPGLSVGKRASRSRSRTPNPKERQSRSRSRTPNVRNASLKGSETEADMKNPELHPYTQPSWYVQALESMAGFNKELNADRSVRVPFFDQYSGCLQFDSCSVRPILEDPSLGKGFENDDYMYNRNGREFEGTGGSNKVVYYSKRKTWRKPKVNEWPKALETGFYDSVKRAVVADSGQAANENPPPTERKRKRARKVTENTAKEQVYTPSATHNKRRAERELSSSVSQAKKTQSASTQKAEESDVDVMSEGLASESINTDACPTPKQKVTHEIGTEFVVNTLKLSEIEALPLKDQAKPYICPDCGERHSSPDELKQHYEENSSHAPSECVVLNYIQKKIESDDEVDPKDLTSDNVNVEKVLKRRSKKVAKKGNVYCDFCLGSKYLNRKTKKSEAMVCCFDCGRSGHPSCMELDTPKLLKNIYGYGWQCMECKACDLCDGAGNDDQILFCDECDRGCHMYCLKPKMSSAPEGNWSCPRCLGEHDKYPLLRAILVAEKENESSTGLNVDDLVEKYMLDYNKKKKEAGKNSDEGATADTVSESNAEEAAVTNNAQVNSMAKENREAKLLAASEKKDDESGQNFQENEKGDEVKHDPKPDEAVEGVENKSPDHTGKIQAGVNEGVPTLLNGEEMPGADKVNMSSEGTKKEELKVSEASISEDMDTSESMPKTTTSE